MHPPEEAAYLRRRGRRSKLRSDARLPDERSHARMSCRAAGLGEMGGGCSLQRGGRRVASDRIGLHPIVSDRIIMYQHCAVISDAAAAAAEGAEAARGAPFAA